jgi:hypothetical protein
MDDRIRTLNWIVLIWEGAAFEEDGYIFESVKNNFIEN